VRKGSVSSTTINNIYLDSSTVLFRRCPVFVILQLQCAVYVILQLQCTVFVMLQLQCTMAGPHCVLCHLYCVIL
jgi:hypothetical protein